ncbi:hypothetical protein GCM10011585_14600 [Edaphobacter dinghuensis]|uniref:Uncharacterized protein n=1 Tax=Edaphobacter dinghuensis TaxID=1560005 RepID=A0A917M2Q6_9BACT|nr:hypothetical protein GCM10011585_14600 [Edaphobacter dinghuensis]
MVLLDLPIKKDRISLSVRIVNLTIRLMAKHLPLPTLGPTLRSVAAKQWSFLAEHYYAYA